MNRTPFEAALDPETVRHFLNHAIALGFTCDKRRLTHDDRTAEETWTVTSAPGQGQWLLQMSHTRWVLVTQGIPQIRFSNQEALIFLDRLSQKSPGRAQAQSSRSRRVKATV